jgi:vacuolar-type H+-ATPase subunit I/STV1
MKKFQKAYISLQTFLSGTKLEDILKANLNEVRELSHELADQGSRLKQAEKKLRSGADRAELVKFNSFEHMGAELSFALALLNQEGTGVVLTGIHSVEECRVYAKTIEKGQSMVKLSREEKLAIEKALSGDKV